MATWRVTGAGDGNFDGVYTQAGTYKGYPYYVNDNSVFLSRSSGGEWCLTWDYDVDGFPESVTYHNGGSLPGSGWVADSAPPAPTVTSADEPNKGYLGNTALVTGAINALDTAAPASRFDEQGWSVGTEVDKHAYFKPGAVRDSDAFAAAPPVGFTKHGYRTLGFFDGTYSAGDWILYFTVINDTTHFAQQGRAEMRLWKGTAADGRNVTEITSGFVQSAVVSFPAGGTNVNGTVTAALEAVTFRREYLFLEVAWYIAVSGGHANAKVKWVQGEGEAQRFVMPPLFTAGLIASLPTHLRS